MVPVYLAVAVLRRTPALDALTALFAPAMGFFGLPAEGAVVLTLGFVSGLYAAIGAMASFPLTAKEVLILAVMLSFAHNLLVETAVTRRLGVAVTHVLALRLGLAAFGGLLIHWFA